MNSQFFLRVAINRPLRQLFDYRPQAKTTPADYPVGGRVRVPFGRSHATAIIVDIVSSTECPLNKLKSTSEIIDRQPRIPEAVLKLCHWASRYYHQPIGEVLSLALPPSKYANTELRWEDQIAWTLTKRGTYFELPANATRQIAALEALKHHNKPMSEPMLKTLGITRHTLKLLAEKTLITATSIASKPWTQDSTEHAPPLTPNQDQSNAINIIQTAHGFAPFLLYGVTGSGKTEVYLQVIGEVLKRGQPALVLVPEINLTPQTLNRFRARFHTRIELYHSGLTDLERKNIWVSIERNQIAVIIATRSGIFLPFTSLGIIVVDEEHDGAYKQNDGFRYNGRDLAIMRSKYEACPIILGSGTPSAESWLNAHQHKYQRLDLTERAGAARPPHLTIQDLRGKAIIHGFSEKTLKEIGQTLNQGHQVLIFKNRRGYAPTVLCHDCGWIAQCHQCDVKLTLHNHPTCMICHHCDRRESVPIHCQECNSTDLRPIGQGTERIHENLSSLFPHFPALRVDRDSTSRKEAFKTTLKTIHEGQPLIMIGTQMLAKGHHFPNVTLVVILGIDNNLSSPDYRASERLAQLVLQVSGRAGRGKHFGEVILQTHEPDHPTLKTLVSKGYTEAMELIMNERRLAGMRPFSYIAVIRAEANNPTILRTTLSQLSNLALEQVHCWGPIPAPIERIAGRFRYQVFFKSLDRAALHQSLNASITHLSQHPNARQFKWSVDVDPYDLF